MKQELVYGKDIPLEGALDFFDSVYRVRVHNDEIFSLRDFIIVLYASLVTGQDFSMDALYNRERFTRSRSIITQARFELTPAILLEINLLLRYVELAKPMADFDRQLQEILDLYEIYDSIELCVEKIGKISSTTLKQIYGN